MHRHLLSFALVCLIAAGVGCSMCQSPYDYCAATVYPNGQPTGGFMTRQGSVLGGAPGVPYMPTAQQPTPAQPAVSQSVTQTGSPRQAVQQASATLPADEAGEPEAAE